jgi:hypothetical protein
MQRGDREETLHTSIRQLKRIIACGIDSTGQSMQVSRKRTLSRFAGSRSSVLIMPLCLGNGARVCMNCCMSAMVVCLVCAFAMVSVCVFAMVVCLTVCVCLGWWCVCCVCVCHGGVSVCLSVCLSICVYSQVRLARTRDFTQWELSPRGSLMYPTPAKARST